MSGCSGPCRPIRCCDLSEPRGFELPPVTITRPGEPEPVELLEPEPEPGRRIPTWTKVAAVVVVVAVIALANEAAARRERQQVRAAADRVDLTLLASAGDVRAGEFEIALVVANRSGAVTIGSPRLLPPAYEVTRVDEEPLAANASTHVEVWLRATCPAGSAPALQMAVPVTPESGREREVLIDVDAGLVGDQSRRACGYRTAAEAAQPRGFDVTATQYSVTFRLEIDNVSDRSFVLHDLTSPGLALGVRDGVPVEVFPHATADLQVTAALPACSRLPAGPSGRPGRGSAVRFGTITLELIDATGEPQVKQYPADGDLRRELLALRTRICPTAGL